MATSPPSDTRSTGWLHALGWLIIASAVACRGGCSAPLKPQGATPELIRRVSSPADEGAVRVDIDDASPAFLVAGSSGPIRIWTETASGADRDTSLPDAGPVLEARFSAAGVFVVPEQGPITLWNWHDKSAVHTYRFAHHGRRAAVSADGRFVAVGGAVLEVATDRELGQAQQLVTQSSLAFSANGKRVVSAGFHEPRIVVRDLPSGSVRQWLASDKISNAALSPSAEIVAASVKSGRIHFWRLPSGDELGSWQSHADVRGICFRPAGSAIIALDPEGFSVVDIASTQQTWRANLEGELWAFACDGELVAAGTTQGELWLWDVARQVLRARLRLSTSAVAALDISATRQRIAAADEKGQAGIWSWK